MTSQHRYSEPNMTIASYSIAPRSKVEILRKKRGSLITSAVGIEAARQHFGQTVGLAPLSHHDLRHFLATRCIESGVDIPTVSRWLGHSDGGALAMWTYGHLRQKHSQAQATKVRFDLNIEKPAPSS